ncbi:MAG: TlpA family protein disulfide reductase [Deltaproteobacteria bacterium]|nr:TlpA family protein disulfide reductase [Deltaproteobacteria bacterium]
MSGLFARLGLAVARPRWALTVASDRQHAGRSGSDLLVMIVLLLAATELRWLYKAAWLGGAVDVSVGIRAAVHVLTRVLTVDLGFIAVGAFLLFALGGAKRELGRAFDLACVAALPLLFVDLLATTIVHVAGLEVPNVVMWILAGSSYAWCGALVALAIGPMRRPPTRVPALPPEVHAPARIAGWGVALVVLVGTVVEGVWVAQNLDLIRPMRSGDAAPPFALPTIGERGTLGATQSLASAQGKVVVLDFWATWCGPCVAALPKLEALAKTHPDVVVLTINLDDAVAARALFDAQGYTLGLLADDGDASERYGVSTIPHSVVIDRSGRIREVLRGKTSKLDAAVRAALAAREIRK